MRLKSFSTRLAMSRTVPMSTSDTITVFVPGEAAGIEIALADHAVHRRDEHRVGEVDLQLVETRLRRGELGLRDGDLRHRGVVARLGVLERLLRDEPALEARLRALERACRDVLVVLARDDRGAVDLDVGLRLVDLLAKLAVFDLGDLLAACHAIAKLNLHRVEPAGHARHDVDGGLADRDCRRP